MGQSCCGSRTRQIRWSIQHRETNQALPWNAASAFHAEHIAAHHRVSAVLRLQAHRDADLIAYRHHAFQYRYDAARIGLAADIALIVKPEAAAVHILPGIQELVLH